VEAIRRKAVVLASKAGRRRRAKKAARKVNLSVEAKALEEAKHHELKR